jgi:predicted Zn-ribbon and HTH transcriptional regulator
MNSFAKPGLEVAEIFERFSHELGRLPQAHRKVIQDIRNCRTSRLGGHRLRCDECSHEKQSYNSCRNRHCPKCQFTAKVRWIEKRTEDLLECPYFHVVFTVPSELNALILRNKRKSYDILFKAASQTLKEVAQNPKHLGAEIGFIGVLHTWGQNLLDHPHIHFIVPGGGLNPDKTQWVQCQKDFLMPVKVLSRVFRGKILSYFEKAFDQKDLEFMGTIDHLQLPANFKELLMSCAQKEWVVYSKEPFAGPKQVIEYLGQYTHRIAITNYRLVKIDGENVHFKVRDRDNPKEKKILVLTAREFMRRFLLHVLPRGYVRIRHFGLLGSRLKKMKIAVVRQLQGVVAKVREALQESWQDILKRTTGIDPERCPNCKTGTLRESLRFALAIGPP